MATGSGIKLTEQKKLLGHFKDGEPVGQWISYDTKGNPYNTSNR